MHEPYGKMTDNPIQAATAAIGSFTADIKRLKTDIECKLQQQEERLTMFERKSIAMSRPALGSSDVGAPHQKAFDAYLRSGDDAGLRGLDYEGKSMMSSVNTDGGFLVDPQTADTIKSVLRSSASLRQVSSVVQVEASAYDVLVDHSELGTGWANETAALTETATPKIDRISIALHELSALPKISQRLLDDSAFDIEGWLATRIADRFARAEGTAFINGDGIDKPKGMLTHPVVENASWSWGKIGYVASGSPTGFNGADTILDLVYSLGAQYRGNATFVMNSKTAGVVRKLKDNDGRFLWSDSLQGGEPARLVGYPVLIAEDMPDIADGAMAVAFGDFSAGYTVAERPDLRVLRDPFSAKPHVLFYATKRVGGDVSDFAAIKLLKFALS